MKNYYQILDISKTASSQEIKKAYRQAAMFWHPDKNKAPNSENKFIDCNEAYNILINPEKRKIYDNLFELYTNKSNLKNYEASQDYKDYNEWVVFERIKATKLSALSSDKVLTDTFHFLDKKGWLIILALFIAYFVFAITHWK